MTPTTPTVDRSTGAIAVVGAGIAGLAAALTLADAGRDVVLIDRRTFPRRKACGGCLNERAVAALDALGVGHILDDAPITTHLSVHAGRHRLRRPLPPGRAMTRATLDERLRDAAVERGVRFLGGQAARLGDVDDAARRVHVGALTLDADVVLLADGLAGTAAGSHLPPPVIRRRSPIGLAVVLPREVAPDATDPGEIRMMIGPGGYVGVTRVEGGRLTIGAAIDPRRAPAAETARDVVVRIVRPHRPGLADALAGASPDEWFGAPPLARRRPCLATSRVLVIGDAAGYVEPFTGEGMAWALDAGRRAA
ncbi:MAG: FAD-dependent monooxygenase, partial [Phycisphaerales bacterium]|nr:FAD-dependent monooxygenase [Phycisphaerales bacterium]